MCKCFCVNDNGFDFFVFYGALRRNAAVNVVVTCCLRPFTVAVIIHLGIGGGNRVCKEPVGIFPDGV